MSTNVSWRKGEKSEIKFSARAFLDLLAGRITPKQGNGSLIHRPAMWSKQISIAARPSPIFVSKLGPDADDDHIVDFH
ncbi:hypothetical protein [Pacificimonas flava]|uniref:hypothetical protein n=1 Tax=Pacificimonas flava TaxID=1234595 RepID=UPI00160B5CFE|nr:hypothetical protein [Pacificimonas flava]MBB5281628.1 hypothetical protein [Pacificimonas flava]